MPQFCILLWNIGDAVPRLRPAELIASRDLRLVALPSRFGNKMRSFN